MDFATLESFLRRGRAQLAGGPVAVVFAEDMAELVPTLSRLVAQGFRGILLLAAFEPSLEPELRRRVTLIGFDPTQRDAVPAGLNPLIAAAQPGTWFYWCYGAEFLFHPFSETRNVRELLTFHASESRDAMIATVVDLYAGDLQQNPTAVSRDTAHFDRSGYYALTRHDAQGNARDRQSDIFGGLRRRFDEHIPWQRRRIDRVALFRSRKGLEMRPDLTFSIEEHNTLACPWHRNVTAAIASFRTARALATNPASRHSIRTFMWPGSEPFAWSSDQLLEAGLMEPGQWF